MLWCIKQDTGAWSHKAKHKYTPDWRLSLPPCDKVRRGHSLRWQGRGNKPVLGCGFSREEGFLEEGCTVVRRIRKEQHQINVARVPEPTLLSNPAVPRVVLKWLWALGKGSSSQLWHELWYKWEKSLACLLLSLRFFPIAMDRNTFLINESYLWCNCWNQGNFSFWIWSPPPNLSEISVGPGISDEYFGD